MKAKSNPGKAAQDIWSNDDMLVGVDLATQGKSIHCEAVVCVASGKIVRIERGIWGKKS